MKKNCYKITFSLLFFFLFSHCSFPDKKSIPDHINIEKEIDVIIRNQLKENEKFQFRLSLLKKISESLKSISTWIRIIFYFIVIVLLILLFYFIIHWILSGYYHRKKRQVLQTFHDTPMESDDYLNQLINSNDFSQAILFLHKKTILYLMNNNIVWQKNLTNFDYYRKIKDIPLRNAFQNIFRFSEKILFDHYAADKTDYETCSQIYLEYFLKDIL